MTMGLFRKNNLRSPAAGDAPAGANGSPGGADGLLPEREFVRALTLERKRAERSRKLFPDPVERDEARRVARGIKRGIDLLGATMALVVLTPVLVAVAIAIKLTSRGPVLFRQKRIGQYGVPFTCLKFRSMHAVNDAHIHKDYVTRLIAGRIDHERPGPAGHAEYRLP